MDLMNPSGTRPATNHARVAQLEEAPDLGSGCWGFESLYGYHFHMPTEPSGEGTCITRRTRWVRSPRLVPFRSLTRCCISSIIRHGRVAQRQSIRPTPGRTGFRNSSRLPFTRVLGSEAERLLDMQEVAGALPAGPTNFCIRRPTGRVSGLRDHTVWVRIPPGAPKPNRGGIRCQSVSPMLLPA